MDVVTAFLQSKVEEDVHVRQAPGYEVMDKETGMALIMKLKKSMYGPRQSPRNFNNTFDKGIREIEFLPLVIHACTCMDKETPTLYYAYMWKAAVLWLESHQVRGGRPEQNTCR